MGFEPTTASLEGWNSTTELRPQHFFSRCRPIIGQKIFPLKINTNFNLYLNKISQIQSARHGGQARVRTLEADGSRFTVCPR